ncbi:MAG: hypothetical protein ABS897_08680 [Eubacteriales bacterium]
MKEFVRRLSGDKEFAAEFREFMTAKNEKVKEGTRLVGEQLNKLVMGSVKEFAASKGMNLNDDVQISKSLAGLSKQIGLQMDDMIVKNFAALEGSMKQPIDMTPEMAKVIRENKELYAECMHKADKAVAEATKKFMKEMDDAVMAANREFAEKTGYKGPYPSTEINKAIAGKLNEVIRNQQKALMEISKTAV